MTIAELFVTLGIKGEEKTKKAVKDNTDAMKDLRDASLATKAAIVGVFYGLEQMLTASAKSGMALKQFGESTGLSVDTLQRWQYAARQFGVQGEEVASTAKSIQSAMTNMLLGKGAPEGLAMVANKVGFDPARARDTFYVMEQLQKFSKTVPPDIASNVLKSFGISENMFQFFRQNKQSLEKIRPSNIFSQREIDQLAKVDVAWSNLMNTLKLLAGRSVSQNGLFAVNELSNAVQFVMKLKDAFVQLLKVSPELKYLFLSIAAIAGFTFAPLTASIIALTALLADLNKGDKGFLQGTLGKKGVFAAPASIWGGEGATEGAPLVGAKTIAPSVSPQQFGPQLPGGQQSVEVNQTLNFQHDGTDAQQTAGSVSDAIHNAFRQMPAQAWGG